MQTHRSVCKSISALELGAYQGLLVAFETDGELLCLGGSPSRRGTQPTSSAKRIKVSTEGQLGKKPLMRYC